MLTHPDLPRSQWLRLWTALPAERIRTAADALSGRYVVEDIELPQSGLGLLPLNDGALGEAYYLGEIPLARAHVRIADGAGKAVEGGAIIMDDRARLARSLAILDGVLAAGLPGFETARTLLNEGAEKIREITVDRQKLMAATRVDFSLLGTTDEEDDDA
ncbi:MAG: phosphonate C-P lyase system protein PhnG [Dechloromonas sp.]|jgi:alpha-D-ribose 1-methylphosphonate 5-triphosphate synthase subunit PhnG|nr:phosphonate C-P lyase system protein PhnG [Dechloromonas sp.]